MKEEQRKRASNGAAERSPGEAGRYRIGAVSDLTGIPPETLRAWERRYGTVEPSRSDSGFRLYSEEDVERLLLIRRLSNRGNAIGSIARLSREELRGRLDRCVRAVRSGTLEWLPGRCLGDPVPIVAVDGAVAEQIAAAGDPAKALEVVATVVDTSEVEGALEEAGSAVVVVGLPELGEHPVKELRRLLELPGVLGCVVHFQFGTRKVLRQLTLAGAHLVKGPLEVEVLARAARDAPLVGGRREGMPFLASGFPAPGPDEDNPEPRFSPEELARLREVSSQVECECPNHLASLVSSLRDFEAYCRSCEDTNEDDAEVHLRLYRESGAARLVLERALAFLLRADGIEV